MQPQPLTRILHYPVTAALIAAALTVTGIWWSGHDIEGLFMTSLVWEKLELWRAFTSTLPHVDFFHLAFNLYWLWIFGTFLEKCYGHIRLVGIFALLAFTSSTGEFIFLDGGVGLSGIGYGLWGLLWALEKNDPAFHGVLDLVNSEGQHWKMTAGHGKWLKPSEATTKIAAFAQTSGPAKQWPDVGALQAR